MQKMMFHTGRRKTGLDRATELFAKSEQAIHQRSDRLFARLMIFQWLAGIAAALWISPWTWSGAESSVHWHVWSAIFLGGALAALPVAMAHFYPGHVATRHCIAVAQTLFSALFIHLSGGRIETHFHIFGSLAFLTFYRDWRVLVTATAVVTVDHVLRGVFWPQSVFGVLTTSNWRWLEHTGWVIFEDLFLFITIRQSTHEMFEVAVRRASLEGSEHRFAQAQRVAHVGSWEWNVLENTMQWSDELFRILGHEPGGCTPTYQAHLACVHPNDQDAVAHCFHTALATKDSARINHRILRPDGSVRMLHSRVDVVVDEAEEVVRLVGTSQDITKRARAEERLRASEAKFRSVTQSVGDAIISTDAARNIVFWNRAAASMFGYEEEEALGKSFGLILPADSLAAYCAKIAPSLKSDHGVPIELRGLRHDGTELAIELMLSAEPSSHGAICTTIVRDITQRKHAEELLLRAKEDLERRVQERTAELIAANAELQAEIAQRQRAQKQLLETSRAAGMAEVATSVLHNVGNVLNSVNISCSVLSETVRNSSLDHVTRTAELLRDRSGDLTAFLANDPIGQKLPDFLGKIAARLAVEQSTLLEELQLLTRNIEHIKDIVAMQQSYGRVSGVTEVLQVTDLVEDSLRMNAGALTRHEVRPVRQYAEVPPIKVEKHKVLQILVNLIRNAKYACDESGRADKRMILRVSRSQQHVQIAVIDNGIGIAAENLTRIFSHGFTTRQNGHGFGLHSAVLAAQDLGGRLTAHSDGPGAGATFTLDLPLEPGGSH